MTESQVRALFNEIADGATGPSPVDPQAALRRGRARLRRRRACRAGVPVLAAVAVAAVILAMVAGPFRPARPVAPSPGPPAPRQFNPLIPNAAFGWLPAGQSVQQGRVSPAEVSLLAGSATDPFAWSAYVYARGQCHLTGPARGLDCAPRTPYATSLRFSAPAPAVHGRPAFWGGNVLVWQYARGGWAGLLIPVYNLSALRRDKALLGQARKIAAHLRMGATSPPIVFPAQLTGLTSQWQLHDVHFVAGAGVLQADSYMLTTGTSRYVRHVGDQGIWTNAPYFDIHSAPAHGTCDPHDPSSQNTSELLNGYHVVLKRSTASGYPKQEVCAAHADGLWADITEFGQHLTSNVTSLFRQLRLLGSDPANWTKHPIR